MKARLFLLTVFLVGIVFVPVYAQEEPTEASFEGISFSFDASLASGAEGTTIEAVAWTSDMPIWATNPAFVQFTFEDYADGASFYMTPQLSIYATADFADYTDLNTPGYGMSWALDDLQALLEAEPDLADYVTVNTNREMELPFLPVANAAQVFRAQPEYIDFGSGSGIRFIAYYSQSVNPITDMDIFYTFQGVTEDGTHYISAVFPVKTGILPDEIDYQDFDYTAFEAEYTTYLDETAAAINELDPEAFAPSLTILDELVASITIEE